MLGEVLQSVSAMIKERPDFHVEEFLSNFVNDRPETVMELPPREFLRRWAAWLAGKAGWRGDHLHLRIPEDLKVGDFYSWLHAAIKVLSSNDMFTPYLPKGESLKIGSSLVFVGERIMRDWSMKKAVFLAARIAAGDLDAAQSKEEESDGSGGSSYTGSSGSWSSSGSGSGGETVDEGSENDSDDDNSDAQSSSHLSRGSTGRKSSHSGSSRHSQVTLDDDHSGSGSTVGSDDDESSGGSSSDISEDDAWSKAASNHSGGSSRGKVEISIGTRIKQQNQVRRVLGDEDALAADLAEMEEESRLNMIRERREALKQKLLAAKQKKQDKKKGSKKGKKSKKREEKKKDSKVSFQEGEDKGKNGKGKNEKGKGKKKKKRRKRKLRLKVNTDETDEQRELRQLLMVRDAIIKNNKPLREGSERIYKTMKMAAAAVLTGIRSYRSTMGFFFKFKPPKELEESATPKERMATVVDLFRQYLPAGFLVDFGEWVCMCDELLDRTACDSCECDACAAQILIAARRNRIMLCSGPCLCAIRKRGSWEGWLEIHFVLTFCIRQVHACDAGAKTRSQNAHQKRVDYEHARQGAAVFRTSDFERAAVCAARTGSSAAPTSCGRTYR